MSNPMFSTALTPREYTLIGKTTTTTTTTTPADSTWVNTQIQGIEQLNVLLDFQ